MELALSDAVMDSYESIITIEDGTRLGGFGSAVAEYVAEQGAGIPVRIMGVPDKIVEHGTQRELHDEVGIGPDGIADEVRKMEERVLSRVRSFMKPVTYTINARPLMEVRIETVAEVVVPSPNSRPERFKRSI